MSRRDPDPLPRLGHAVAVEHILAVRIDDLALDRLPLVIGYGRRSDLGAVYGVRISVRIAEVGVWIPVGPVRPAETADEYASAPPTAVPVAMPMPAAMAMPVTTSAVPVAAATVPPAATTAAGATTGTAPATRRGTTRSDASSDHHYGDHCSHHVSPHRRLPSRRGGLIAVNYTAVEATEPDAVLCVAAFYVGNFKDVEKHVDHCPAMRPLSMAAAALHIGSTAVADLNRVGG